jgi:hypothetical protein
MSMTLLAEIAGDGASSVIDFTSISQSYKSLKLTGKALGNGNHTILVSINGTTFTDYCDSAYGGSTHGSAAFTLVPFKSSTTATTGAGYSYAEIDFPNYTQEVSTKNTYARDFFSLGYTHIRHGNFSTSLPITSIQITANSYFETDTILRLWGLD